jgi:hypothetical protein
MHTLAIARRPSNKWNALYCHIPRSGTLQETAHASRHGVRAGQGGNGAFFLMPSCSDREAFPVPDECLRKLALKHGIRHEYVNPQAADVIDRPRSRFLIKAGFLLRYLAGHLLHPPIGVLALTDIGRTEIRKNPGRQHLPTPVVARPVRPLCRNVHLGKRYHLVNESAHLICQRLKPELTDSSSKVMPTTYVEVDFCAPCCRSLESRPFTL